MILTYNRKRSCHHSVPSIAKLRSFSVQQVQMCFMKSFGKVSYTFMSVEAHVLTTCVYVCVHTPARMLPHAYWGHSSCQMYSTQRLSGDTLKHVLAETLLGFWLKNRLHFFHPKTGRKLKITKAPTQIYVTIPAFLLLFPLFSLFSLK